MVDPTIHIVYVDMNCMFECADRASRPAMSLLCSALLQPDKLRSSSVWIGLMPGCDKVQLGQRICHCQSTLHMSYCTVQYGLAWSLLVLSCVSSLVVLPRLILVPSIYSSSSNLLVFSGLA